MSFHLIGFCPDVAGLSQLVMSALEQGAGEPLPPLERAAEPMEDGTHAVKPLFVGHLLLFTPPACLIILLCVLLAVCELSPHTIKEESPYITVLACWASQDEADTDSSNEEEDTEVSPAPSGGDLASDPNIKEYVYHSKY